MSWRYQKMPNAQIPVMEYVDAVWNAYTLLQNLSGSDIPTASPLLYLASDSESAASEFTNTLVTNDSLVQKYGNENLKPIVYDLRSSADAELRTLAPAVEYVQAEWNNRTEEDRIRETRGVIVDWALLSGAWPPEPSDESAGTQIPRPAATICTLPYVLFSHISLAWRSLTLEFLSDRTFASLPLSGSDGIVHSILMVGTSVPISAGLKSTIKEVFLRYGKHLKYLVKVFLDNNLCI